MIKFKNGSEIRTINTYDSLRGNRSKIIAIGKYRLKYIVLDLLLKFKSKIASIM